MSTQIPVNFFKSLALPHVLPPNSIYFVKQGAFYEQFLIDENGDALPAASAGISHVSDQPYGSAWNGITGISPSKNAVYDELQSIKATYQLVSGKNAANGYAGLDANGKVDPSVIPAQKSHEFVVVANQTARLALTANQVQPGDEVFQNDTGATYVLIASDPSQSASWHFKTDVTPDWSTIANKPTLPSFAVNGNGSQFLSNDGTYKSVGISIGNAITGGASGSVLFVDADGKIAQNNNALRWNNSVGSLNIKVSSDTPAINITNPTGSLWYPAFACTSTGYNATTYFWQGDRFIIIAGGDRVYLRDATNTIEPILFNLGFAGSGRDTPRIGIVTSGASVVGMEIKLSSSHTANAFQVADNAGVVISYIDAKGGWHPASLADANAQNGSIYYSTNASKLVYKDAGGVVNNLY